MTRVIIIGNGKLKDAIKNHFCDYSSLSVIGYSNDVKINETDVLVHVGSGRQYVESLKMANKHGAAYIQAATEKEYKLDIPFELNIKYISASNLDINIIKLLYWLEMSYGLFDDERKEIVESHQKEKKSKPGTAISMCGYLNIAPREIISIRDPEIQKAMNISNTGHHAYHRIEIGDDESKIMIETKIEGALSYVKGLAKIVECLPDLESEVYEVEDLVKLKLL